MTKNETTLARYAKAIAAVVEAGGPRPLYELFDNGVNLFIGSPLGGITDEPVIIAVLEKYVREDVVVWVESVTDYRVKRTPLGTEAHIGLLESIASVVAGEKGEVENG